VNDFPEHDQVVLVDVKPERGVEDPKLVAELQALSEGEKKRKTMNYWGTVVLVIGAALVGGVMYDLEADTFHKTVAVAGSVLASIGGVMIGREGKKL
jgi:hypothetical protein